MPLMWRVPSQQSGCGAHDPRGFLTASPDSSTDSMQRHERNPDSASCEARDRDLLEEEAHAQ
jgi:hypothetical protein